jgi:hypothetical protein
MALIDVLVGVLAGALGGIIVAIANHFLSMSRWKKEFGLQKQKIDLMAKELDAKYEKGVRIKAISALYEKISSLKGSNRWLDFKSEVEAFLNTAEGHRLPIALRNELYGIINKAEARIHELSPDADLIDFYYEEQEKEMEKMMENAPPDIIAERDKELVQINAMSEMRKRLSDSLLKDGTSTKKDSN